LGLADRRLQLSLAVIIGAFIEVFAIDHFVVVSGRLEVSANVDGTSTLGLEGNVLTFGNHDIGSDLVNSVVGVQSSDGDGLASLQQDQ
jgi:hypothetical protein